MANDAKPLTDEEIIRRTEFKREVNRIPLTEPVTCYSCRSVSVNGGILHCARCYDKLRAEIETDNALLAERDHLLDALPCPAHGRCVPHALEQIASLQSDLAAANERLSKAHDALHACANLFGENGVNEKLIQVAADALAQLEAPRSGATEEEDPHARTVEQEAFIRIKDALGTIMEEAESLPQVGGAESTIIEAAEEAQEMLRAIEPVIYGATEE